MKRLVLIVIGGLVALTGLVWTLQGLGYIGGSFMTGATLWAVIGGPSQPLQLGPALFLRQPPFPGCPARPGWAAGGCGWSGRLREQRGEAAGRRLPVAQLGAML